MRRSLKQQSGREPGREAVENLSGSRGGDNSTGNVKITGEPDTNPGKVGSRKEGNGNN